jgi:ABC-type molybdenum transport system ATPase subunit/photorepair protein PhrA
MKRFLQRLMGLGVSLVMAVHHAEDLPKGITGALRLHKRRAEHLDLQSAN